MNVLHKTKRPPEAETVQEVERLSRRSRRVHDFIHSLFFSGPSFLGMLIFFIIPFGVVVYYSFIAGALDHSFAGLKNYISVIQNGAFKIAVKNTAVFSALSVPLAVILALALAYPWNMLQLWRFLLPALYDGERRVLGWWIVFSSVLFFGGVAFCTGVILPMLMNFSGGFATPELQPILGLANFLNLAGWLMLAFGVMFQAPIAVLLAVRFGAISTESLKRKRPYVMTAILILAAILTPPDIVSQVALAIPTWLLFELGLFLAGQMKRKGEQEYEQA